VTPASNLKVKRGGQDRPDHVHLDVGAGRSVAEVNGAETAVQSIRDLNA
jgi:hypothetical protein